MKRLAIVLVTVFFLLLGPVLAAPQEYKIGHFLYKIRKGDSLEKILLGIGHPKERLKEIIETTVVRNNLESPDRILAGQYLWVPALVEVTEKEIYLGEQEQLVLKILESRMDSLESAIEEIRQNATQRTLEPILKDLGKNEKYLIQILESLQKQQESAAFKFALYWLLTFGIAIMAFAFSISAFERHILKKN